MPRNQMWWRSCSPFGRLGSWQPCPVLLPVFVILGTTSKVLECAHQSFGIDDKLECVIEF